MACSGTALLFFNIRTFYVNTLIKYHLTFHLKLTLITYRVSFALYKTRNPGLISHARKMVVGRINFVKSAEVYSAVFRRSHQVKPNVIKCLIT
jgi:hypothetical protein